MPRATSRPMPRPAPVTIATSPAIPNMLEGSYSMDGTIGSASPQDQGREPPSGRSARVRSRERFSNRSIACYSGALRNRSACKRSRPWSTFSKTSRPFLLLGPGPSTVPEQVYRAMRLPTLGYLDFYFVRIMDGIKADAAAAARTRAIA